jgi:hypothetical protein
MLGRRCYNWLCYAVWTDCVHGHLAEMVVPMQGSRTEIWLYCQDCGAVLTRRRLKANETPS